MHSPSHDTKQVLIFKAYRFGPKMLTSCEPGKDVVIDTNVLGYPIANLRDLPAGDYYVQAVMNVYTQYHRADGHTIWAHQDQWEGQHFNTSPGNLISSVQKIHYDPSQSQSFSIKLDSVLPARNLPPDTKQVKHIKIKSKILSDFWGHDMYLGATILLPKGFDEHPNVHYPVVYEQSHFGLGAPQVLQQRKGLYHLPVKRSWTIIIWKMVTPSSSIIIQLIFRGCSSLPSSIPHLIMMIPMP